MRLHFIKHKKIGFFSKYIFYYNINNKKYINNINKYSFIQKIDLFNYVYKKSTDKALLIFNNLFAQEIFINDSLIPSKYFKLALSIKINSPEITQHILSEDFSNKDFTDLFFIPEIYKNEDFKKIDKISNKQSLYYYINEHYNCFNESLLSLNYSNKLFENNIEIESQNSLYENNIYALIYNHYLNNSEINYNYENILKRYSPEESFIALTYINMFKYSYHSIGNKIIFKRKNRENFKTIILNSQKIINDTFSDNIITDDYLKTKFLNSITKQFIGHKIFSPYKTKDKGISVNIHNMTNQNILTDYFSLFEELKREVDFIDFNFEEQNKDNIYNFLTKMFLIQYIFNKRNNKNSYINKDNDFQKNILEISKNIRHSDNMTSFLKNYFKFIPDEFYELKSMVEKFLINNNFQNSNNDLPKGRKRL